MSDVPPTPPTSGEPAWLPDPSGRHQLRWWDGTQYTDAVADAGTTSTDPIVPAAGPAPSPAQPPDVTGREASKLPVVLAVAGAALVVIALVVLLGGDDGDGTGQFSGEVTDDEEEGRHEVSIDGGSVLVVEVEPEGDFDPIVGFDVSEDVQERIEELFEDTPLEGIVDSDDGTILESDSGGEGDDETAFVPLPFDADAIVVVRGFEGSEGSYEIRLESFDIDVDEDDDIVDMIEAVAESDDVPLRARRIAEDVLELIDD